MHRTRSVIPLLFLAPAFAQNAAFEVADVKPNQSGEVRMAIDIQPGGRVTMRNVPMKVLIVFAYRLRPEAVASGPSWIDTERYDIIAKAPETSKPDDVRVMMRTLLADQFKLAVHAEQRPMPAYALLPGKSGSRLQPSDPALLSGQRCVPGEAAPGQRRVECKHVTAGFLADYLQELAPRDFTVPVVDQTGLTGVYDFKLEWMPRARPSAADGAAPDPSVEAGPSIFDAVEVQLGLKLESRKLPLPVIVVDHIER